MNGSDAMELEQRLEMKRDEGLTLPLKSMTKEDIATGAEFWLNDTLEAHSAADLWVFVKQMEETVEVLKARLKPAAFNSIAESLGGSMSGEVLGAEVKLTYPKKWMYTEKLAKFVEQQKRELKALQANEQADGSAMQVQGEGVITVTLKGGKQ